MACSALAAWAVILPLSSMILFTLVFGKMARMPSDGIPYPIFCYCALVPWTYFSSVLATASTSLTDCAAWQYSGRRTMDRCAAVAF